MTGAAHTLTARLRRVLRIHFDPDTGTPYWLDRARELGIDPRREIAEVADLPLLGPLDPGALAQRPIEEMIPRSVRDRRAELLVAETGGTLGRPKFAVHRADEFEAAFIEPFLVAARRAGFPHGENWLFVGPTGPHIIGKAAQRCAAASGSPGVFAVDFDPRWAKKLPADSFARKRYLRHIEEQALRILATQRIGVLFSTPPVLSSMCAQMTDDQRLRIRGVHFGGMAVSAQLRSQLAQLLPRAVLLSGFGNTLFGMMPELAYHPRQGIDYYPHGVRLVAQVVQALGRVAAYGERGQIVMHRLDETQFIPNMVERDTAVRIAPRPDAAPDGFVLDGIRDPQPIVTERVRPALGLY